MPVYQVLSEDQVKTIHGSTLDILENTGLAVSHKKALEMLAQSGAKVDFTKKRVCFPPELVEKSLKNIPKEFICAGRDPEFDFKVAFENPSTGCVDMSMGISKQGLVIGDDIWGNTKRLLAGFNSEPQAFALDAIKRVSKGSGYYLTDDHTRQFVRKEAQHCSRCC